MSYAPHPLGLRQGWLGKLLLHPASLRDIQTLNPRPKEVTMRYLLLMICSALFLSATAVPAPELSLSAAPPKLCTPAHLDQWQNPETNCSFTCVASPRCTAGVGSDVAVPGACAGTGPGCTFPCGTTQLDGKTTYQCVETELGCTSGNKKRCVWNPILVLPVVVNDCCTI